MEAAISFLLKMMIFHYLWFEISIATVCYESQIYAEFRKNKLQNAREVESWRPPSTWRSLLTSLEEKDCTEFHGDLIISDSAARKSQFGENVRLKDIFQLKRIKKLYGLVSLDLKMYPEIKNLSFLSNLTELKSPSFRLVNSQVEELGLSVAKVDVLEMTIAHNKQLCYLQRFLTLGSTIVFEIEDNKNSTTCALEGKKCSTLCDPNKGCWGPSARHCFQCLFRAGSECVSKCESRRGFFTRPGEHVCGRCHVDCEMERCPQVCRICREEDLMKDLWRNKPGYKQEMEERGGLRWTPRYVLLALRNCTVYYGNVRIKENSILDTGFNEYIRVKDLENLRNLREIYGFVYLNLRNYRNIRTLSFLSALKKIETSHRLGLTLLFSNVDMIGFMNIRLNVPRIGLAENKRLCYLHRIETLNSSIKYIISGNKIQSECRDEEKVCSVSCDPNKGCWGPTQRHCFECRHWKADNECVDTCESRRLFEPPTGQLCVGCHESCRYGCFGPSATQCYSANDQCPRYKYFNKVIGRCEECSRKCFGDGYDRRHQLTVRACTGPGNFTGPGGCSNGCPASASLKVSADGRLECDDAELQRTIEELTRDRIVLIVIVVPLLVLAAFLIMSLLCRICLIRLRRRWSKSSARCRGDREQSMNIEYDCPDSPFIDAPGLPSSSCERRSCNKREDPAGDDEAFPITVFDIPFIEATIFKGSSRIKEPVSATHEIGTIILEDEERRRRESNPDHHPAQ